MIDFIIGLIGLSAFVVAGAATAYVGLFLFDLFYRESKDTD